MTEITLVLGVGQGQVLFQLWFLNYSFSES